MKHHVYDIFCDASVMNNLRGACSGACVVYRPTQENIKNVYTIQPTGTSNSGELEAIANGVITALEIYEAHRATYEEPEINIFSDSMISVRGLKEWIFHWDIKKGVLLRDNNSEVLNQNFIKMIMNLIYYNRMPIRLYHQKGHVNASNMDKAYHTFKASNGIYINDIGLTIDYISRWNNFVDTTTRDILRRYFDEEKVNAKVSMMYTYPNDLVLAAHDPRYFKKTIVLDGYKKLINGQHLY